jgi:ABC-type multidrug transport system fused ATPase/permease subunit
LTLNKICLTIEAGEKIGICGRTGSGKSTLIKLLTWSIDLMEGSISIDFYDINKINIKILRSEILVIS